MHELSIAESLIKIIGEEMAKHGLKKLHSVKIVYGQISAIVPEALEMAFEVLTVDTPFAGAAMEIEVKPMVVRCRQCGQEFSPTQEQRLIMPCPQCATELGHEIISGRELYIENIEAE
ncbi:MAG: hydrogenase maturation nickel metallochaperone HypA [Desulfomicrobium sp.]|nr:hydrogenase maturation nickel metallochaperone HypA [Pseudomonadota bacterium]MBV1710737.1 hydrogenase maturation nickel metallochaperone HypA [Desulfomicrobium sp.]MBU4570345.1 hydrogenase maturation nickel metallochaperone HypA [Pseudomonadota bacterium]MBU4593266.1 hydrogenase maturation nickel metallochaperone HypA [Pseudomonadota bacterium]MBV1719819.1 hydrogenase maturation nickel metallochaperone HypA [Desulfomicrobium sp.]